LPAAGPDVPKSSRSHEQGQKQERPGGGGQRAAVFTWLAVGVLFLLFEGKREVKDEISHRDAQREFSCAGVAVEPHDASGDLASW